jgi:hypothetical protein
LNKRLGAKLVASLRDLNIGSNQLPCTRVILSGISASVQRVIIIGPGAVCSRDANGCSGRRVGNHTIAVKHVARRPGAGSVGSRANCIASPNRAVSDDVSKANAIGNGGASGKLRQLTWIRRARASAQRLGVKIFRRGPALGRVATSFSPFPMNTRASVFAARRADWRYVACWIARHTIGRGVGVGAARV